MAPQTRRVAERRTAQAAVWLGGTMIAGNYPMITRSRVPHLFSPASISRKWPSVGAHPGRLCTPAGRGYRVKLKLLIIFTDTRAARIGYCGGNNLWFKVPRYPWPAGASITARLPHAETVINPGRSRQPGSRQTNRLVAVVECATGGC